MKNKRFGKLKITFIALLSVFANLSALHTSAAAQKVKTANKKPIVSNKTKVVVANKIAAVANKTIDNFDVDEAQLFALVNAERSQRGLKQLLWDDEVADIARAYSKKMATENFFGHFDADGKNVGDRAKAARLKHWSKIGENLFSIENLALFDHFAVKNWMKSPTHRDNILALDWTTSGIGIAKSETGEIFITQVFIKR
jgi:uncharacterized protein YkwD